MWGGAGSDNHDKIRASIGGRIHHNRTLSEDRYTRNKRAMRKMFLGYTRDARGKVISRRIIPVSNTIHTAIGSGGNTDFFVIEFNEKDYNQ